MLCFAPHFLHIAKMMRNDKRDVHNGKFDTNNHYRKFMHMVTQLSVKVLQEKNKYQKIGILTRTYKTTITMEYEKWSKALHKINKWIENKINHLYFLTYFLFTAYKS